MMKSDYTAYALNYLKQWKEAKTEDEKGIILEQLALDDLAILEVIMDYAIKGQRIDP